MTRSLNSDDVLLPDTRTNLSYQNHAVSSTLDSDKNVTSTGIANENVTSTGIASENVTSTGIASENVTSTGIASDSKSDKSAKQKNNTTVETDVYLNNTVVKKDLAKTTFEPKNGDLSTNLTKDEIMEKTFR